MNVKVFRYEENKQDIDEIDRSICLYVDNETLSQKIVGIIKNSLLNNMLFVGYKSLMGVNLILLGHLLMKNKTNYELLVSFQIGIIFLDIFGKFFISGLIKSLKDKSNSVSTYVELKILILFLILVVIIPVSFSSYFAINFILNQCGIEYYKDLNLYVYLNFFIWCPVLFIFEIFFSLNLKLLYLTENIKLLLKFFILNIVAHTILSYLLMYVFRIGLKGLTISYFINCLFFYLSSNKRVNHYHFNDENNDNNNFYFFPNINDLSRNDINITLKKSKKISINFFLENFPYYFIFLASIFSDQKQLIISIIYLNFYEIIKAINKGFEITLKNYLLEEDKSYDIKRRFIIIFSICFWSIGITLFIILLTFKSSIVYLYLYDGGDNIIKTIAKQLDIIFPFCILNNYIYMALNGFAVGLRQDFSYLQFFSYLNPLICMGGCLLFFIEYNYNIVGLWIGLLISSIFYILIYGYKAVQYFKVFFGQVR